LTRTALADTFGVGLTLEMLYRLQSTTTAHTHCCFSPQVVDSLLDEVVSAGVDRSLDPTLLEPSVLDRILTSMEPS
jgi:hypothetical protein